MYLNLDLSKKPTHEVEELADTKTKNVDWRTKGAVSAIKD